MKTYFLALVVLAIAFLACVLAVPLDKGDLEENLRERRFADPNPNKGGYYKGGGGGGGGGGGYYKGGGGGGGGGGYYKGGGGGGYYKG